jgi:hypothetical protein
MKRRLGPGLLLITIGLLLLLRTFHLLPEDSFRTYLKLSERFWPVLLILAGLRVMLGAWHRESAKAVGWLIVFLVALWLLCRAFTPTEWIV